MHELGAARAASSEEEKAREARAEDRAPRARESAVSLPMVDGGGSPTTTIHPRESSKVFDEIIRPLERAQGARLDGPNRTLCRLRFEEDPAAFRWLADYCLRHANGRPIGLLVYRIKHGWPEAREAAAERPDGRDPRRSRAERFMQGPGLEYEDDDALAEELRRLTDDEVLIRRLISESSERRRSAT